MFTFPVCHFSSELGVPAGLITEAIPFTITIAASATSNTATISSVDTSLSTIIYGGFTGSSTDAMDADHDMPALVLTDGTTVTASRQVADATTITIKGTVIVWASSAIESIQTGIVSFTGSSGTTGGAISAALFL